MMEYKTIMASQDIAEQLNRESRIGWRLAGIYGDFFILERRRNKN